MGKRENESAYVYTILSPKPLSVAMVPDCFDSFFHVKVHLFCPFFFIDKQLESLPRDSCKLRARSKSLVKSLKKLSRSVSCSGSVPRFVRWMSERCLLNVRMG